uniref:Uncharacterized protein n=1 Tax=Cacopsylla melanoneura TaxID=428564 RepID=A0A8D8QD60_9HEMI
MSRNLPICPRSRISFHHSVIICRRPAYHSIAPSRFRSCHSSFMNALCSARRAGVHHSLAFRRFASHSRRFLSSAASSVALTGCRLFASLPNVLSFCFLSRASLSDLISRVWR